MHSFLAIFILLSAGWIALPEAGDSCQFSGLDFCKCNQYPIGRPKQNASRPLLRSIAPTTVPKIRDQFNHTVVECDLRSCDRSSLKQITSRLYKKWVDKLVVTGIPLENEQILTRLPENWLKNVRVKQLEITHSSLAGDFLWQDNPFKGQDNTLVWLSVVSCSLSGSLTYDTFGTVNLRGLENLPGLEGIDLSTNFLVSVERTAFGQTHLNLNTIVLSRNSIQRVEPGAFETLSKLQYIDLSHNVLENIARGAFGNNPKRLRNINLSWNQLKSLPENIFSNMTALRVVDVSNNFLYSLPEKPWKSVWVQLQRVDVSNNFIQCDCDILWLTFSSATSKNPKQRVKGQCARTLPSLFVRHFDLDMLTKDKVKCAEGDEEDNDYDYYDAALTEDVNEDRKQQSRIVKNR